MREGLKAALVGVDALRVRGAAREPLRDEVVVECPVALLYNGEPFAVMMATPADLEDYALGFALAEGIVAAPDEFRLVDHVAHEGGVALHAAIPQSRFDALQARRRGLEGRSGCGLCGVESIAAALRPLPRVAPAPPVAAAAIHAALRQLAAAQPLNARSGGVHAAAFAFGGGMRADRTPGDSTPGDSTPGNGTQGGRTHGDALLVREDVGRHNALDKLVGAMARAVPRIDPRDGFALVTSRASHELVLKAATAGIGTLVAISAPTDLAIRSAEAAGLTLVAFARDDALNVYTPRAAIV